MSEQLDEIQWKSPEFIQERGLQTANVLEYFALSPFYDRTSNNQVLMMQFQFQQIQIPMGLTFQQFFQSKLQEMTGTEFVVAYTREPDFWVIRKQKRLDTNNCLSLQDYYVIGANVYQAPKIYDVLSSRLLLSVLSLKNSIDLLNGMTKFEILDGGHSYNNTAAQLVPTPARPPTANTTANTVTPTPQTAGPATATVGSNNFISSETSTEITAGAFDNLLNNVVQSTPLSTTSSTTSTEEPTSVYLDDRPLYGKGSTVEMLGLKINLNEE